MGLGDSQLVLLFLVLQDFDSFDDLNLIFLGLGELLAELRAVVLELLDHLDFLLQGRHLDVDFESLLLELGVDKSFTGCQMGGQPAELFFSAE